MVLKAGLGERLGGGMGGMICHRPQRQAGRRGETEEGVSRAPSQVGAGGAAAASGTSRAGHHRIRIPQDSWPKQRVAFRPQPLYLTQLGNELSQAAHQLLRAAG